MLPEIANFSTLAIPNPNHSPISHKNKNFGMSSNWIPQQTPDGKEFWFNPSSGQSTFTNPFERDFKEMKTPDGGKLLKEEDDDHDLVEELDDGISRMVDGHV